ncbi:MAG TPA: GDSL-type esterase/lipase family protein, partial [Allocoleopsis sp.]
ATWEGRDRLLNLPNQHIAELNRQLESIAREEGVYFLDLYSLFANAQGNLNMMYSTDGLHLNDQGYHVWSIALQVYSREVLEPDLISSN